MSWYRALPCAALCTVESVSVEWGETTAERVTMISEVHWLNFEPAELVQQGEVFWVEDRTLFVRGLDGAVRTRLARERRPDTDRR